MYQIKKKNGKPNAMVSKIFHQHTLHTQWSIPGMLAGQKEIQTTFQQELAASVPLQLLLAVVGYADKDNRILRQKGEGLYMIGSLFLFSFPINMSAILHVDTFACLQRIQRFSNIFL